MKHSVLFLFVGTVMAVAQPKALFYMTDSPNSVKSFTEHADKIDILVPAWYGVDGKGTDTAAFKSTSKMCCGPTAICSQTWLPKLRRRCIRKACNLPSPQCPTLPAVRGEAATLTGSMPTGAAHTI